MEALIYYAGVGDPSERRSLRAGRSASTRSKPGGLLFGQPLRPLLRAAGFVLAGDGLRCLAGARRRHGRRYGRRRLAAAELGLGLALLDRAPVEPETLYRAAAPVYDTLSPIWHRWLYPDAGQELDALITSAVPTGGDVLDLGCGTGAVLDRLRGRAAAVGTYTGVDPSAAMLGRARAKHGHLAGVRLERRDLRRVSLPEGPYDLVVSAWALEHLPAPGALVAAARQRLRPDGRLVCWFELDGSRLRASVLRRVWRFWGVRLIPEQEARAWPGVRTFQRWAGPGPHVAVVVVGPPALPAPDSRIAGGQEPV